MDKSQKLLQLKDELKRVTFKRSQVQDADIRSALDLRITSLKEEVDTLSEEINATIPSKVELPLAPTPEQAEIAYKLFTEIRLERQRGLNTYQSKLDELRNLAPGYAPLMLDDIQVLVGKGFKDLALEKAEIAIKVNPEDRPLQDVYAQLVFEVKALPDSLASEALSDSDALATGQPKVLLYSILIPGLGQILLDEVFLGWSLLIIWAVLILVTFQSSQLWSLLSLVGIKSSSHKVSGPPSLPYLLCVLAALGIHLFSIIRTFNLTTRSKQSGSRARVQPPVNLPYD